MRIIKDVKPKAIAANTQAQLDNPGITYNQAGVSFNDSRYSYGGAYGQQDVFASPNLVFNRNSIQVALRTNQGLFDPSITYNQPNTSYNDSRYAYGGVFGQGEILPLISLARTVHPRIIVATDFQGTVPPVPTNGIYTPIGLLLTLTHFKQ